MNEMITKDEMVWCLNKFSQSVKWEHMENSDGNIHVDIRAGNDKVSGLLVCCYKQTKMTLFCFTW